uniref:Uncharacterized protein n=1 Tax=Tetranychus urticae TaxID=32264 RepID=T1K7G2_TETUR
MVVYDFSFRLIFLYLLNLFICFIMFSFLPLFNQLLQ